MVGEAPLKRSDAGLVAATDGWFVSLRVTVRSLPTEERP